MKYKIDYARSGRSTCRGCQSRRIDNNKIEHGTLRIAINEQSDRFDNVYENWYHIECLFDGSNDDTPCGLEEIEGIQSIRHADLLLIVGKINIMPIDFGSGSKRARFNNSCELDASLLPLIASQNELYYRIYDAMSERNPAVPERQKKKILIEILDLNKQFKPVIKRSSTQVFLAHAVDILAFGAMEICSECSQPGYIFDGTFGYVCKNRFYDRGGISCNNRTMAPQRRECIIPEKLKKIYPILNELRVPTRRILFELVRPLNATVERSSVNASENCGRHIFKSETVVDPLSGMQDLAHVYSPHYGLTLTKTRVQDNRNSFYTIQLLESDDNDKYWLFVHYGRIGTVGTHNLTECATLEHGQDLFHRKYQEIHDHYHYEQLDIDYSDEIDAATQLMVKNDIPSTLPESVQRLVEMCFDTHVMEEAMIELQFDLNKFPLGKLSKSQIEKGYDILNELLEKVNDGASVHDFGYLTDRFYTCIPHNVGAEPPAPIDNLRLIGEKAEMLNSLSDIQLTCSLLSIADDNGKSTVDNWYDKLKTNIEPLDRSNELFTFLEQYVIRTHSPYHNFKLVVEDIFKITRDGEAIRYEAHKSDKNRFLLWHGSRVTNFVGILKNGLKIAPIKAERTGNMFGNGIYFADVVTKSAQYCRALDDRNDGQGLLLLCEVAMGEMDRCFKGFRSPRSSMRSVKGCGRKIPNPMENVLRNGVVVPCGNLVNSRIKSELSHNEFVVYDESRVKIEYLCLVKFQQN